MMKHTVITAVVFLGVAVSAVASAQENHFDYLSNDLDLLEEELMRLDGQQEALIDEIDYQKDEELIPEGDSDIREQIAQERASTTHVYTYVGDTAVVFEDVPVDTWFGPYVRDMADRGIISGYKAPDGSFLGKYGPADQVTIEQLAKIAVEAADVSMTDCTSDPINEAAKSSWSADYIACSESLIWSVYAEGTVDITKPATRRDVILTILQAFNRELEPATGKIFKDVSSTLAYRDAIETAYVDGIVEGYKDEQGDPTGYFGPFDPVNRAEIAKMVSLAIQLYGV